MARGAAVSTLPWSPGTLEGQPSLSSPLPGSMVGDLHCGSTYVHLTTPQPMTGSSCAETNLKKQGMLPLTFSNPADYDKVRPDDRVSLSLADLAPGKPITCVLRHSDGSSDQFELVHTYNEAQIDWFKAGSALNQMAKVFANK